MKFIIRTDVVLYLLSRLGSLGLLISSFLIKKLTPTPSYLLSLKKQGDSFPLKMVSEARCLRRAIFVSIGVREASLTAINWRSRYAYISWFNVCKKKGEVVDNSLFIFSFYWAREQTILYCWSPVVKPKLKLCSKRED